MPVDKEGYEKSGFITYKSQSYGIKSRPSYMDIPNRRIQKNMAQPLPQKVFDKKVYPQAINLILRNTDYLSAFVGFSLVRDYCQSYDITPNEGSVLIILSYHDVMFNQDLRFWCMNQQSTSRMIVELCRWGFITPVKVPSTKNAFHKKSGYTLSTLGVNFVLGFEEWFNSKMEVITKEFGKTAVAQSRTNFLGTKRLKQERLKKQLWNDRIFKRKGPKS